MPEEKRNAPRSSEDDTEAKKQRIESEDTAKDQRTEWSNGWKDWNSKDGKANEWSGWNNSSSWRKDDQHTSSNKEESWWKSSGWSKSYSSWSKADEKDNEKDSKKENDDAGKYIKKENDGAEKDCKKENDGAEKDCKKENADAEKYIAEKYIKKEKDDAEKDSKKPDSDWAESGWKSNGWKQSAVKDEAPNNDWNRYSKNDWTANYKDRYGGTGNKRRAGLSEREENFWKYDHGSYEWKTAVMQGEVGCKFVPGDEVMSRVMPSDFRYFTEDDCAKWKNKPLILTSTESFWVFGKSVNWVCSNTSSQQLKDFQPGRIGHASKAEDRSMLVDGSLPAYIVSTFGKDYPFVCENTETYDVPSLREAGLEKAGFGMLHRLDRETSGPVLVAKTQEGFKRLVTERDNHNWHKEYVTLCHGLIPPDKFKGVIDIPLRRKLSGKSSFIVDACDCWKKPKYDYRGRRTKCRRGEDSEGYRCLGETKSYYEVVKYFHYTNKLGVKYDYTFVRIKLVSGKTHQIRVHMRIFGRELNLPVYGVCSDFKYLQDNFPDAYKNDCDELCSRVFLHSVVLGFRDPDDPFTNRVAQFKLQNDLMNSLKKLGSNEKIFEEMLRYQTEVQDDKFGKFALDFGINGDAENAVRSAHCSGELLSQFYEKCPDPAKKPAARSFNGDHSAMILRILNDYKNDVDSLDELVNREFPELMKRDDENLKLPPGWVKKNSRTIAGAYYYFNTKLNIVQIEHPARAEMDGLPPGWRKIESKSKPGKFYYYDSNTSTSHVELPADVKEYKSEFANVSWKINPSSGPSTAVENRWVKRESTKQRGCFYWFNPSTNTTSIYHPLGLEPLPEGWIRETSTSIMGKYYFTNTTTKLVVMQHPKSNKTWSDAFPPWQFAVSKSDKNICYWINTHTKQTTTVHPVTGIDVRQS